MDGWWDEIESEIAGWLEHRGEVSVAELAGHLALSEEATASLIAVLTVGSPVQICRIARSPSVAEPLRSGDTDPVDAGVIVAVTNRHSHVNRAVL